MHDVLQNQQWLLSLGTFLPLLVGMRVQNGLDFPTALLFAGWVYLYV